MSPTQYPESLKQLLYADETGDIVGLDEVQLLDPIPEERIAPLTKLLNSDDVYIAYQSGLILAAWGIGAGVEYLHSLIRTRIDRTIELEPHRLWQEDNVYDVIAEAFGVAVLSGYDEHRIADLLRELLGLYGECFFESKLKRVLVKLDDPSLLPDIITAMQAALQARRFYQASQLVPVIAHYDKALAAQQLPTFTALLRQDDRIKYNLDETHQLLNA